MLPKEVVSCFPCRTINELQDKTPISGDIRWKMEWGKTMMIPGIGINFKQIKANQREELIDKYSL
jgi:hypothetical protein